MAGANVEVGMWKFAYLGYVFLLFSHSSEIREKRNLVLGFGNWFEILDLA